MDETLMFNGIVKIGNLRERGQHFCYIKGSQLPKMIKKKVDFFTCSCHKLYSVEAAVYLVPIILLKLQFLWVCEIWGNFLKNRYFVNNCLIKIWIQKSFCTYVTHMIVIVHHTHHILFLLNLFLLNYRFHLSFFFCYYFLPQNHLALFKDLYLKKMLFKT